MRARNKFAAVLGGTVVMASAAIVTTTTAASAVEPTGGCWVYNTGGNTNLESAPTSSISSALAGWSSSPPDYDLTTSGGTLVGETRNFSLVVSAGPSSPVPATTTAYYYFSVNGANLAPVAVADIPASTNTPGGTVTGSFDIAQGGTNTLVLRKVIYDIPSYSVRVQCNGQSSGSQTGINPATSPVDTNVTASFTAFAQGVATITGITNQTVMNAARAGDTISFAASNFSGADANSTAEICTTDGATCVGATSFGVGTNGAGTGTITVPSGVSGSMRLRLTSGGEVGMRSITILGQPTLTLSLTGGGAGTTVGVTGTDWDPSQTVSIGGYTAPLGGFPLPSTTDPVSTATASATGTLSGSFTVNDANTAYISASQRSGPGAIWSDAAFAFSADTCTAKEGLEDNSDACSVLETIELTVLPGDLTMAKAAGTVEMGAVQLNGTDQTSTGSLQDVTVMDYRGGTLGWSLIGTFAGLTSGPQPIDADKLSWTPSCTPGANSDDTVTVGAAGAFPSATEALPLCAVAAAGFGPDGVSGGDVTADADLSLDLLINQQAGDYSGTLTLTLS
ncbi:hypothetical protein E8D34_04895 [Nocardioides sp. GY 10113]|uniref:hypothetical protein n=1 Tax=Nocardioides sp. GY 10113 TaxID=2569761 RepID=UPI0010A7B406|nr:hypothetical protein [Nocardioides sp. GY 10113]TIC88281.1 hypothetical protein E8D34_04895 [Nocardioides sp. GY 10113]